MDSTLRHFSYHSADRTPTNNWLVLLIQTITWSTLILKGFPYRHPHLRIIHRHKQDYQINRACGTVPDLYWSGCVAFLCHITAIREKQV